MKKIGIFYGSTTGNTKDAAYQIASNLSVDDSDVHDVAQSSPSDVAPYDVLLLGSSTWGSGELQDDWYDFLSGLEVLDLKGKKIGLFGCGDESMSDTFCGALGEIYERLKGTGAEFIGAFNADGYSFEHSPAEIDGKFVGLLLDDVNHSELTQERIKAWCDELKAEM
ncbi:MAG: flavodoxin [Muribaculaceae bacterium]|nr:flavodoxin [Muribaculaceae bacterium]